jgi:hypothetical protein
LVALWQLAAIPEAALHQRGATVEVEACRGRWVVAHGVLTAVVRPLGTALVALWRPAVPEAVSRQQGAAEVAAALGHLSAAAESQARRSAGPAVSARQAAAPPREEPEARDAAEAGVEAPHEEAVAAPREEEAVAAVLAGAAVLPAVAQGAVERQRAAPDAAAVLPWAAVWAVAWAFRRDQVPPWPAP